jgi:hypothetical protein
MTAQQRANELRRQLANKALDLELKKRVAGITYFTQGDLELAQGYAEVKRLEAVRK